VGEIDFNLGESLGDRFRAHRALLRVYNLRLICNAVKGNLNLKSRGCRRGGRIDAMQHERSLVKKFLLRFAFEQARFSLGQVSYLRAG
jgi:hypothetical protein